MAAKVGYVQLPGDVVTRSKENFKTRKTGTHYTDANGEKRSGPVTEVFQQSNLLDK